MISHTRYSSILSGTMKSDPLSRGMDVCPRQATTHFVIAHTISPTHSDKASEKVYTSDAKRLHFMEVN